MKKTIRTVFTILLILVFIIIGIFMMNYYSKTHRNSDTVGKSQTEFTANENGTRIVNIPFDSYITDMDVPVGAIVPKISEKANGEDNSKAINEAIKSLSSGGVVYIPSGEYKVSTIRLESNVTLFISKNAKVKVTRLNLKKANRYMLLKSLICIHVLSKAESVFVSVKKLHEITSSI